MSHDTNNPFEEMLRASPREAEALRRRYARLDGGEWSADTIVCFAVIAAGREAIAYLQQRDAELAEHARIKADAEARMAALSEEANQYVREFLASKASKEAA